MEKTSFNEEDLKILQERYCGYADGTPYVCCENTPTPSGPEGNIIRILNFKLKI
jgi:hypothetical protein